MFVEMIRDRFSRPEQLEDRRDAGRRLAALLGEYADRPDLLVLGLPRGGVPVAAEIAGALHAPLDIWLVRKLGAPGHEELAIGAIAPGTRILSHETISALGLTPHDISAIEEREALELARRLRTYRGDRPAPEIAGRCVIVVDDGLATGASMRAAVASIRALGPGRLVIAVPVAPASAMLELRQLADDVVVVLAPQRFGAVGLWYADFTPTSDDEVIALLQGAWSEPD